MRLEFHGLKSADRSVELSRLNLFRGPVGSGKSSCLDALRFLALGYVPQNGKAEAATARLMRGTEIGARLSLNGRTLERRLICEQVKGVTRYRAEATDSAHSPKAKATEHSERIRGLFGSSDAEAAENLDLRALLSLSGNERAKKVQALLANTSGMSVDEIMSIVGPLAVCRVAEYPEAKIPTDAAAIAGLAAGFLHALDAGKKAALHAATEQVRQWLGEMTLPDTCERANMAKSEAARALAEKKAARTELENRKMQLGDVADTEVNLSTKRDAAIQRRGSLQGEIDRAIRMHQNLAERPDLAPEQRAHALFVNVDARKRRWHAAGGDADVFGFERLLGTVRAGHFNAAFACDAAEALDVVDFVFLHQGKAWLDRKDVPRIKFLYQRYVFIGVRVRNCANDHKPNIFAITHHRLGERRKA